MASMIRISVSAEMAVCDTSFACTVFADQDDDEAVPHGPIAAAQRRGLCSSSDRLDENEVSLAGCLAHCRQDASLLAQLQVVGSGCERQQDAVLAPMCCQNVGRSGAAPRLPRRAPARLPRATFQANSPRLHSWFAQVSTMRSRAPILQPRRVVESPLQKRWEHGERA